MAGARAAFGGGEGGDKSAMPRAELSRAKFQAGYNVVELFCDAGLASSKSEGRRLVEQGGAFVSAPGTSAELSAISNVTAIIGVENLDGEGELVLRAGKKRYCLVRTS